jgi:Trehalose-6-phosphate synthase
VRFLPAPDSSRRAHVAIKPSAGGLVSGLRRVNLGDDSLWIGWTGSLTGAAHANEIQSRLAAMHAKSVSLSRHEIEVFYEEICNAVLWPLCHDRIDQVPLRVDGWDTDQAVNQRYAEAVVDAWCPGDSSCRV